MRVLSLGVGKQSSKVYVEECETGKHRIDAAIFADTQREPQAVYDYLAYLQSLNGPPIHVVTAGDLGQDVLDARGRKKIGRVSNPPFYSKQTFPYPTTPVGYSYEPGDDELDELGLGYEAQRLVAYPMPPDTGGMLWRGCTRDYKIRVIEREIRRLAGVQPRQRMTQPVTQLYGISLDEMQRMRTNEKPWITNEYPLVEQRETRDDCEAWLVEHGHPPPPKSACYFCPYRSNAGWRHMRDTQPDDFAQAIAFDEALRDPDAGKLPGVTGDVYVHRSFTPLKDADLGENGLQMDMFNEECAGVCGV